MISSPATLEPGAPAVRAPVVTNTLSAILFREILAPLAAGLGPAGDIVLERVVDGLFVQPRR